MYGLQMNGMFYYASLQYNLTAFQYNNPTVRFRQFNRLIKIISLHLYHRFRLFSPAYLMSSLYIKNIINEKVTVTNKDSWQISEMTLMISLRLWLFVSYSSLLVKFLVCFIKKLMLHIFRMVLSITIVNINRLMISDAMSQ